MRNAWVVRVSTIFTQKVRTNILFLLCIFFPALTSAQAGVVSSSQTISTITFPAASSFPNSLTSETVGVDAPDGGAVEPGAIAFSATSRGVSYVFYYTVNGEGRDPYWDWYPVDIVRVPVNVWSGLTADYVASNLAGEISNAGFEVSGPAWQESGFTVRVDPQPGQAASFSINEMHRPWFNVDGNMADAGGIGGGFEVNISSGDSADDVAQAVLNLMLNIGYNASRINNQVIVTSAGSLRIQDGGVSMGGEFSVQEKIILVAADGLQEVSLTSTNETTVYQILANNLQLALSFPAQSSPMASSNSELTIADEGGNEVLKYSINAADFDSAGRIIIPDVVGQSNQIAIDQHYKMKLTFHLPEGDVSFGSKIQKINSLLSNPVMVLPGGGGNHGIFIGSGLGGKLEGADSIGNGMNYGAGASGSGMSPNGIQLNFFSQLAGGCSLVQSQDIAFSNQWAIAIIGFLGALFFLRRVRTRNIP